MTTSLSPIIPSTSKILDNGAGSGMLTSLILSQYPSTPIIAADISPGMLRTLESSHPDWKSVETVVADAMDLLSAGLTDAMFSHSLGTFFLPFVPDPKQVLSEMRRVTQPGGVVGISTWSRVSWVPIWQAAVRATVNPEWTAPPLFHVQTTELSDVKALFEAVGLEEIEAREVKCPHPKKESPEKAVEEFLGMGNPSTKLLMKGFTEEEIERIRPVFVGEYGSRYRGVEEVQEEVAVLIVGRVPK